MKTIKLGIIGGSDGNGHPFSWSAIINGYDEYSMSLSGYPVISAYLSEQKWPEARIQGARVDYVYTQSKELSARVANAAIVSNISTNAVQMLGHIDGLLLARDDAENHFEYAKEFLAAGVPIFIDKPIAINTRGLMDLWSLQRYKNQIFSCSALTHSLADKKSQNLMNSVGKIRSITAITPNSWNRYGIHIIEPLINYFQGCHNVQCVRDVSNIAGAVHLSFTNIDNIDINLISLGEGIKGEIKFVFCGDHREVTILPTNYFAYFKKSLERFINNIDQKKSIWECSLKHHKNVVEIIEMGH